jgi:amyloid beta precursor protein binding protein 1
MQAINRFVAKEGRGFLPVTGTVVDMTASSVLYIAMQTQHQMQHSRDVACVTKHVHDVLRECGQIPSSLVTTPFADDIETMVTVVIKNIREISVASTTTIEEEYTNKGMDGNGDPQPSTTLIEAFMMAPFDGEKNPEMTGCLWYVLLRACDRFWKETGSYPGANKASTEKELTEQAGVVVKHTLEIQSELGYMWEAGYERAAAEMTRYGGTEVHTVAAYVGGVAGQEAVKLISHQYTPLNSTYVYNGIDGSAGSYLF